MSILDEKIEMANTICILGHQRPDGDCIGSTLSLYNYIINKYGSSKIVKPYLEEFSNKFDILPNIDKISHDENNAEKFDLAIVVDCSSVDRLGNFKRYFDEAKETILFDHHEHNSVPSQVSVVYEDSVATCELLYDFLDKNYINKDVAVCLYVGIATDSGVFRYKSTTKKTFNIVGNLVDYDFDFTDILDRIIFNNSLMQRKAQALVFERLKLICNAKVSFSYITSDELESFNLQKTDIDNIIVYLREIDSIEIAAFAYQVGNDIYKLSLRSKTDKLNVAEFCRQHEGGGHILAAGCIYYGNIDIVANNFEKDINLFING